jgi:polyferredoxin
MGIDIRDGQQLECITCALCIDACDNVMDKVGKERGLISYATLADYNHNMALATDNGTMPITPSLVHTPDGKMRDGYWHFHLRKLFRLRTMIYFAAWSAVGLGILYGLLTRDRLQVNVLHDRNPQFVTLSDGSIRNGYTVKLLNMIPEPRVITVALDGLEGASLQVIGDDSVMGRSFDVPVDPDKLKTIKLFVHQPASAVTGAEVNFRFIVEDKSSHESDAYTAAFLAPEKAQ